MRSPALPVRVRRAVGREARWLAANARSPRARFAVGCDIRAGLEVRVEREGRIDVAPDCVLDRGTVLWSGGLVQIGARTLFGHHCTVAAAESVVIGEDCVIGELVSIRDHLDRADARVAAGRPRIVAVSIGREVVIGAKATIGPGVVIGDHAVVEAGAVVDTDVPAHGVARGVPAVVTDRLRD